MSRLIRFLGEVRKSPFHAFTLALPLARGAFQKCLWRALNRKITVGRGLRLYGRVIIKGPGAVVLGDNVSLIGTVNSTCTLFTYSRDARIQIGSNSMVNGSRFGCRKLIQLGESCIVGDARIADNDGHSIKKERHQIPSAELPSKPVLLGDNVWIGAGVYILKGVKVGNNSVVGAGSVVIGNIPANAFALGNPARVMGAIPD